MSKQEGSLHYKPEFKLMTLGADSSTEGDKTAYSLLKVSYPQSESGIPQIDMEMLGTTDDLKEVFKWMNKHKTKNVALVEISF